MRNLSQFMGEFRGGFQQQNRFRVCVFPPREMLTRMISKVVRPDGLREALDAAGDVAELAVSLPLAAQWLSRGVLINTARTPSRAMEMLSMRTYGVTEHFPYNSEYTPLEVTMPLPLFAGDSVVPRFFNFWQNMAQAQFRGPEDGADMSFPDDYYGSLVLGLFDRKNNPTLIYKFENVYPSAVQSSELSWQSTNEMMQLAITFQYSYFKILSRTSPEALAFIAANVVGQ